MQTAQMRFLCVLVVYCARDHHPDLCHCVLPRLYDAWHISSSMDGVRLCLHHECFDAGLREDDIKTEHDSCVYVRPHTVLFRMDSG